MIQFQIDNKNRMDVVHQLLILMDERKDFTLSKCGNCLQDPCRDIEKVQFGEIREGMSLMVTNGDIGLDWKRLLL